MADHLRTATFILGDERGVTPSNLDQGYVLRRLIRRAVRFGRKLAMPDGFTAEIAQVVIDQYGEVYPELVSNRDHILNELLQEENRFAKTIAQGLKEFDKLVGWMTKTGAEKVINGKTAFRLYDTFGYPLEMTIEMAKEQGFTVDEAGYAAAFAEHQKKSHAGSEQRFKGGLADTGEATARLHTATHLLNAALRTLLGSGITQRGSNITAERLRFDFNFPRKLEPAELQAVEDWVNQAIEADVPVVCEEMPLEEARARNAMGVFSSKYGDVVKVYTMGDYSCEICGGPHAENTGDLGEVHIVKEESSSAGVRRIKAVLK